MIPVVFWQLVFTFFRRATRRGKYFCCGKYCSSAGGKQLQNKGGKTIFLAALAALSFYYLTLRLVCVHFFSIILILGQLETRTTKTISLRANKDEDIKSQNTDIENEDEDNKKRSNVLNWLSSLSSFLLQR